jgi:hypothetical protein
VKTRAEFAKGLAQLEMSVAERAVALLWYYHQTEDFNERTASELGADLVQFGFARPNATRLNRDLRANTFVVRGERDLTFKLNLRRLDELDEKLGPLIETAHADVHDTLLPADWFKTRGHLSKLVRQINGSYEYGFYDGCAALCRRLMESLIIEVYIHQKRVAAIQTNGQFFTLERLIGIIRADADVTLGRSSPKTMDEIKSLGDTAAHDRTYIMLEMDIDDVKARYRRMINDLLVQAGISTASAT